jgi:hypothetical protein
MDYEQAGEAGTVTETIIKVNYKKGENNDG